MLIRNMMRKYYEEAGAEGAASGGAGGEAEKTFTAAEVEAMVAKAVDAAVPGAIKGLKQKNDQLIGERRADQERIAREKARADGKLEEFELSIRAQEREKYEPVVAEFGEFKEEFKRTKRDAVLGQFAGQFADNVDPVHAVKAIAHLVQVEMDGKKLETKFVDLDGKVVTTDPSQYLEWLRASPVYSHLMKPTASSGGGAIGGKGAGGAKSFADMTMTEKAILANTDPAQYARLSQQK